MRLWVFRAANCQLAVAQHSNLRGCWQRLRKRDMARYGGRYKNLATQASEPLKIGATPPGVSVIEKTHTQRPPAPTPRASTSLALAENCWATSDQRLTQTCIGLRTHACMWACVRIYLCMYIYIYMFCHSLSIDLFACSSIVRKSARLYVYTYLYIYMYMSR